MHIRFGFEMTYECAGPTPMVLVLRSHPSRAPDLERPDLLQTTPEVPITEYRDLFGNVCCRLVAPPGFFTIRTDGVVRDSGLVDLQAPRAGQTTVDRLPESALQFLLASRYCESDQLTQIAWQLFGAGPPGWARVQAICDFVHHHITFGYPFANPARTAWQAYGERRGVCRDYAHLAIALCRAMNIPARYCTGYLGDMGTAPPYGPMDFAAWFEAWLGDAWYTFDARNNTPRIGRILVARGRDACDVALSSTFGLNTLLAFKVWTDEIQPAWVN